LDVDRYLNVDEIEETGEGEGMDEKEEEARGTRGRRNKEGAIDSTTSPIGDVFIHEMIRGKDPLGRIAGMFLPAGTNCPNRKARPRGSQLTWAGLGQKEYCVEDSMYVCMYYVVD
jgi:hypothetical protein